jgi:hypothetical protein
VKGNTKYLYALMDYETHFWIAQKYDYYKIFRIQWNFCGTIKKTKTIYI